MLAGGAAGGMMVVQQKDQKKIKFGPGQLRLQLSCGCVMVCVINDINDDAAVDGAAVDDDDDDDG